MFVAILSEFSQTIHGKIVLLSSFFICDLGLTVCDNELLICDNPLSQIDNSEQNNYYYEI